MPIRCDGMKRPVGGVSCVGSLVPIIAIDTIRLSTRGLLQPGEAGDALRQEIAVQCCLEACMALFNPIQECFRSVPGWSARVNLARCPGRIASSGSLAGSNEKDAMLCSGGQRIDHSAFGRAYDQVRLRLASSWSPFEIAGESRGEGAPISTTRRSVRCPGRGDLYRAQRVDLRDESGVAGRRWPAAAAIFRFAAMPSVNTGTGWAVDNSPAVGCLPDASPTRTGRRQPAVAEPNANSVISRRVGSGGQRGEWCRQRRVGVRLRATR